MKGIDTPDNQRYIDWAKVKADSVQFVILRSICDVGYAGADKIKVEDIELTISDKYKEDFIKMYIQYWKEKILEFNILTGKN